jgi:hypothetical protein
MIWFGNLERIFVGAIPAGMPKDAEFTRMQMALERVAEAAPSLSGQRLIDALSSTGWVDRGTAERLLPHFRHFDPDRHFGDYLRRLSFRGRLAEEDFVRGVRCVLEDITGNGRVERVGPATGIRFSAGLNEGIVLAHPEVGLTIGGQTRDAILAAVEEMPDALVVVARSFERDTGAQLASLLSRTGLKGTLVTVNLLLGIRAITLRYQPQVEKVVTLLARGGTLRSPEIARLGDRERVAASRGRR